MRPIPPLFIALKDRDPTGEIHNICRTSAKQSSPTAPPSPARHPWPILPPTPAVNIQGFKIPRPSEPQSCCRPPPPSAHGCERLRLRAQASTQRAPPTRA
ncbi:unnamed protein product [Urochloa humidicola]